MKEIEINGMPLGAMSDSKFEVSEIELRAEDTLLMFSDGLPELQNSNNELYGYKRVTNEFKTVAEKQPEEIIEYLKGESAKWGDDKVPDDDVTFVVLKVK